MENNNKNFEENLLKKEKEEKDKQLLKLEVVIGYLSSVTFLILIFVTSCIEMATWTRVLLIAFGLITFIIGMHNALIIEQTAGYYECSKCHYKYVPTYKSVFFAMHIGRTRYMKCPKCDKKSWQKKVISK